MQYFQDKVYLCKKTNQHFFCSFDSTINLDSFCHVKRVQKHAGYFFLFRDFLYHIMNRTLYLFGGWYHGQSLFHLIFEKSIEGGRKFTKGNLSWEVFRGEFTRGISIRKHYYWTSQFVLYIILSISIFFIAI